MAKLRDLPISVHLTLTMNGQPRKVSMGRAVAISLHKTLGDLLTDIASQLDEETDKPGGHVVDTIPIGPIEVQDG